MVNKIVNILGTPYKITFTDPEKDPKLMGSNGYCDSSIKEINVDDFEPDINTVNNPNVFKRKVVRHEIIHAFLNESGLDNSSDWARNEEMIDFFAIQFEKIYKAFKDADALEADREKQHKTLIEMLKSYE
jgi:hypothetical protein